MANGRGSNRIHRAVERRLKRIEKSLLKRLVLGGRRPVHTALNATQESFCRWNAERLGIGVEESRRRYINSWNVVPGGHRGARFEIFMYLSQEIYSVLHGNRERELFETYRFHGSRDLLRMLTFDPPTWMRGHPLVDALLERDHVEIVDFGCGLAHASRALAVFLKDQGVPTRLHLADIPTAMEPFLDWLAREAGLTMEFLPCTVEAPKPAIPSCNVIFATEFFEHVTDPVEYFAYLDAALRPGGFLVTDVADHETGFLHVSPELKGVRTALSDAGYVELERNVLYRKDIR